jgi:hypothetical protein
MTAGEQAAEEVSRSAAVSARELTERIAGIQNIRADVQMMALNTTLKCSRIGETGKPLGVIAVELRAARHPPGEVGRPDHQLAGGPVRRGRGPGPARNDQ